MPRWDEKDVPSLDGKVAVVTGANSGLGLETASVLARHGAKVLMACRNLEKAAGAADRVRAGATSDVEVVALDLASLASVAECAKQITAGESRLDLLINNAGLMGIDQARTEDGFEMTLGVNHLGHFALTAQLAPLMLATPGSRIINVSSVGHRLGHLALDDLMFERRRYHRWPPYFQSKLANLLFTAGLHRRLTDARAQTAALTAHPGASRTDLGQEGTGVTNLLLRAASGMGQPARIGALSTVRAAVDPEARGGQFYGPRLMQVGYPVVEKPSGRARNAADAEALWARSEELTGVVFDIPAA